MKNTFTLRFTEIASIFTFPLLRKKISITLFVSQEMNVFGIPLKKVFPLQSIFVVGSEQEPSTAGSFLTFFTRTST